MNKVDFIDWLHTEIDAVLYGDQSKEQLLLKAIPMVDLLVSQNSSTQPISDALPCRNCGMQLVKWECKNEKCSMFGQ